MNQVEQTILSVSNRTRTGVLVPTIVVRHIEPEQACIVRAKVLRPHWNPVQCSWPLDDHPRTLHFGGFIHGELAGVASFIADPHPLLPEELSVNPTELIKLRGMATRQQFQGTGIGSAVLSQGMRELAERGDKAVWRNARLTALRFYERHGYVTWGEEFDNPPVGPHIVMWRRL
jgi:GNAT superfamily N-acetyltransferase